MAGRKLTCLDCGQVNRVPDDRLGQGPKCGTCGAGLMPAKARAVDWPTLQKAARVDEVPLVVDLWAPWCGPCRMMAPEFDRAAGMLAGRARLVKLNTEKNPAANAALGVRGIPTLIRWERGRETARQSGAMRAEGVVEFAGVKAGA